ncbi:AAA family ATPase [Isosphaeraceae bacterium EP7]
MYESHFGLSGRPFGEKQGPDAWVSLPSRDAVLRRLRYGLEHAQGPVLLFGPPGSGKTAVARRLAVALGWPAAHVVFPALPAADWLSTLADELTGFAHGPAAPAASLRRLRSHLEAAASRGDRPLLVVDEAQLIEDPAAFESLRLLLNFATLGPPDLALVLVGTADVLDRLPPGLADRLTARALLGPLCESEARSYLAGRLRAAGSEVSLFDVEATRALWIAADGLPRRLNLMADMALLIAYAEGLAAPDAACVEAAALELEPMMPLAI